MEKQVAEPTTKIKVSGVEAAILNMEGVITHTEKIQRLAWKETFNDFLRKQPKDFALMSDDDYEKYIKGKPVLAGIKDFLKSRKINLPEGKPNDPLNKNTLYSLSNIKNAIFCIIKRKIRF